MTTHTWDCADARMSLGVYVLGAIEPAERALVDAHLATCRDCRDELAGLAGLPALLARVSQEELSRIEDVSAAPADEEPPPELITTVLDLAAARRRRRVWQRVAAAAAVVAIAAGVGGGIAAARTGPAHPQAWGFDAWGTAPVDHTRGMSSATGVSADVLYANEHWGLAVAADVQGIPVGTTCSLWVVYKDGSRAYVMSWMTADDEGQVQYTGAIPPSSKQIAAFDITAGGKTLVTVPA